MEKAWKVVMTDVASGNQAVILDLSKETGSWEIYGIYDYGGIDIEVISSNISSMSSVTIDWKIYTHFLAISWVESWAKYDDFINYSALFYYPIDIYTWEVPLLDDWGNTTKKYFFGSMQWWDMEVSCYEQREESGSIWSDTWVDCASSDSGAHWAWDIILIPDAFGNLVEICWGNGDGAWFATTDSRAFDALDPESLNGKIICRPLDGSNAIEGEIRYFETTTWLQAFRMRGKWQRSLFRGTYDPETERIVSSDVWWALWEEIWNIIDITSNTVANFWWPFRQWQFENQEWEYVKNYNQICDTNPNNSICDENHDDPVREIRHAQGKGSIAIWPKIDAKYGLKYEGNYFAFDYSTNKVYLFGIDADWKETVFEELDDDFGFKVHAFTWNNGSMYFIDIVDWSIQELVAESDQVWEFCDVIPRFTSSSQPDNIFDVQYNALGTIDKCGEVSSYEFNCGNWDIQIGEIANCYYDTANNYNVSLTTVLNNWERLITQRTETINDIEATDFTRVSHSDTELEWVNNERDIVSFEGINFTSNIKFDSVTEKKTPLRVFMEVYQELEDWKRIAKKRVDWLITDEPESMYPELIENAKIEWWVDDLQIIPLWQEWDLVSLNYSINAWLVHWDYNIQLWEVFPNGAIVLEIESWLKIFKVLRRDLDEPEEVGEVDQPDEVEGNDSSKRSSFLWASWIWDFSLLVGIILARKLRRKK